MRALIRALFALVIVAAAAPVSAQTTALVMRSEPGDYIGQGQTVTYSPADAPFVVRRNFANGVSVSVVASNFAFWWYLDFSASGGAPLALGYYPTATRYPFTEFVGLSIGGSGRGCNELTGRFLVRDIEYAANGDVLRLAIDAEQHCEDHDPALFVAVRYNSDVPTDIFPGDTAPYVLNFVPPAHGFVTGAGLTCGGVHSACSTSFSGVTTPTLTAIPDDGYIFTGWTGGCSGASVTTIHVNSIKECGATFDTIIPRAPRTLLTMNSASGDYIGQGRHDVYSPDNSRWRVTPGPGRNGVSIWVTSVGPTNESGWTFDFRAPLGQVLQSGFYAGASRAPFRTTTPGLEVSGNGRGCNGITGQFTVHEIQFDSITGAVIAFAADYEQHCEFANAPALTGTVNYHATYQIEQCPTADPFTSLGGGICHNGGWLPPGMAIPTIPSNPLPAPPPPSPGACTTADPFASLGGGTCFNGGWLPPGMTPPGGGTNPTPPPPPPPTGCTTPDPFVSLGGGTCRNGGWLPPGME